MKATEQFHVGKTNQMMWEQMNLHWQNKKTNKKTLLRLLGIFEPEKQGGSGQLLAGQMLYC